MPLLPHNQQTWKESETFLSEGKSFCIVNPCGSGKTSVLSEILKNHKDASFVMLTKQKNALRYYKEKNKVFSKKNITITTYSKMYQDIKNDNIAGYKSDYLILDEAHYMGASKWRDGIETIRDVFSPILIGLTATPQRYADQMTNNTIINEFFEGNSAGNFTNEDLYMAGVFASPSYYLSIHGLDTLTEEKIKEITESDLTERQKEELTNAIAKAQETWIKKANPSLIMKQQLPKYMYKDKCNRILVYIADLSEKEDKMAFIDGEVKRIFPNKTVKSYSYTYRDPESAIDEFRKDDDTDIKILYSIDKIMETIHIDDLKIEIMLRPSVSNRIITQQIGRLNSITNKETPLIIDMVDNISNLKECRTLISDPGIRTKRTEKDGTNRKIIHIHMPGFGLYDSVFKKIDKTLKRNSAITYHEISAGITDICRAYLKDESKVKSLITSGMNPQDAIDEADYSTIDIDRALSDPYADKEPKRPFTESEIKDAEHYLSYAEQYIKRQPIEDEDIIEEIRTRIVESTPIITERIKTGRPVSGVVHTIARSTHITLLRHKNARILLSGDMFFDTDTADKNEWCYYSMDEQFNKKWTKEWLNDILRHNLTERENYVINKHYGLNNNNELSMQEIGNELELSGNRIAQIRNKALRKLMGAIKRQRYAGETSSHDHLTWIMTP